MAAKSSDAVGKGQGVKVSWIANAYTKCYCGG